MASLSRVNVQIGFDGQGAISGMARMEQYLKKISESLDATGKKAEETSKKVSGGGGGGGGGGGFFTEIAAGGFLAVTAVNGIYSLVSGFVELGSQMESLTARASLLAGGWDKAQTSMKYLRIISMQSGISFGELAKSFSDLQEAGFSADASTGTINQFSRAAEALGTGGMAFLTGAYKSLMGQTMATTQTIDELEAKGLPVYQALADQLARTSGQAVSAAEAMAAVKDQTILASQAARAMKDAAQSPAVLEAQQRMEGTLQGQLMRAKVAMEEMTRSIAESFFKAFDFAAIVAGARGAFDAVLKIVKQIADMFGPMIDPKENGNRLETVFRTVRDISVNIAETIAKGALDFKFAIEDAMSYLEHVFSNIRIALREGYTGALTGKTDRLIRENDRKFNNRFNPGELEAVRVGERGKVTDFFNDLRNNIEFQDRIANMRKNRKANDLPAKMEEAAKSVDMFIQSVKSGVTPLQVFENELKVAENVMAEAKLAGLKGDKLTAAQDAVNQRLAAAGANFLKAIQPNSEQWKAPRSDVGTAAAVEDSLRNRFGMEPAVNVQEAMKAALDEANRLKQLDLRNQQEIINAIKNNRPGVAAFTG